MSQINESPLTGRGKEAFRKPLRRGGNGFIVTSSKQSAVAMTSQVYTKPTNRNKNPALVSPKHCELSPWFVADLQIKTNQSCCTNRVTPRTTRQPNWNHVDRGNLVRHTVDTMMERAVALTKEMKCE